MSSKVAFGSLIALILLGLYVYLVWSAVSVIACLPRDTRHDPPPISVSDPSRPASRTAGQQCHDRFTPDMGSAMAFIGGLLAALVIAELAITPPGKAPAAHALAADASSQAKSILRVVTTIYLAVWVFCGLCALVIGWHYPLAVPPLTDLGKAWFGLAIAAGYSYFGLTPSQ
ncbi:MAG TPA: hypothetical protein VF789_05890 [Thermoanaerobaculia bacterium]